jgi:Amt family ammonium transporter
MLTEIIFHGRKMNSLSFCSGAVSGLVAITPASGYVTPAAAMVFGLVSGPCCYYACHFKKLLKLDDALDVWGVHGVGGLLGGILTGFFAEQKIAGWGGSTINGGWIDHHWRQMGIQIAGMCAIAGWSFVVSLILLKVINLIPGLSLRVAAQDEARGDAGVMGEMAWNFGSVANLFDQNKVGGLGLERAATLVGLGIVPEEPRHSAPRPDGVSPAPVVLTTAVLSEEAVELDRHSPSPRDFERGGERAETRAR